MTLRLNPDLSIWQTASDDPRIGHLLGSKVNRQPKVALIGFPSDQGVLRNGGRIGAALAPDAIRKVLYKMTADAEHEAFQELVAHTQDMGDMAVSDDLENDQEEFGKVIAGFLSQGIFPIILGGGHETAFGHFLGYAAIDREIAILNWDAHADVRELNNGLRRRCHHGR